MPSKFVVFLAVGLLAVVQLARAEIGEFELQQQHQQQQQQQQQEGLFGRFGLGGLGGGEQQQQQQQLVLRGSHKNKGNLADLLSSVSLARSSAPAAQVASTQVNPNLGEASTLLQQLLQALVPSIVAQLQQQEQQASIRAGSTGKTLSPQGSSGITSGSGLSSVGSKAGNAVSTATGTVSNAVKGVAGTVVALSPLELVGSTVGGPIGGTLSGVGAGLVKAAPITAVGNTVGALGNAAGTTLGGLLGRSAARSQLRPTGNSLAALGLGQDNAFNSGAISTDVSQSESNLGLSADENIGSVGGILNGPAVAINGALEQANGNFANVAERGDQIETGQAGTSSSAAFSEARSSHVGSSSSEQQQQQEQQQQVVVSAGKTGEVCGLLKKLLEQLSRAKSGQQQEQQQLGRSALLQGQQQQEGLSSGLGGEQQQQEVSRAKFAGIKVSKKAQQQQQQQQKEQ